MAIVISGVNNNDRITASDGTIDLISGVNYVGILTAPNINVGNNIQLGNAGIITATSFSGNNVVANHFVNVGSNIQLGNAGVATATTFVGNLTGNVNNTGNLLLQIGGSEKFRVGSSGQLGIGGANYGTSGQVLTSGGSGSAATWSTINGTTINNNADNRIITGSDTANTLNAESGVTIDGSNILAILGSGQQQLNVGSTNAGGAAIVLDGDSNGDGSGGDYSLIRHNTDGDLEFYARSTGGATNTIFKQGTSEKFRIASDGSLTQTSTKAFQLAKGTTAERPTGVNGMIRYNTSNNSIEGYIDGGWILIKGSGFSENGTYNNNTVAVADDLHSYWNCNSTSTSLNGGDSGQATLYGVSSSGGKIGNSWDRGGNGTGNSLDYANGILLTQMPTGNDWTLGFQLYLNNDQIWSASDGAGILWLDGRLSGGTPGAVILGYDGNTGDDLRFGGNGWISDGQVVESSFAENTWYHMVITKNGGTTWKFYLDGVLKATRSESMSESGTWMIGNYSRINGNGNSNAHFFRGRIDEIGVWHRTLSDAEVSKWYTAQSNGQVLVQ